MAVIENKKHASLRLELNSMDIGLVALAVIGLVIVIGGTYVLTRRGMVPGPPLHADLHTSAGSSVVRPATETGLVTPGVMSRATELRSMDDRSLELIVAQHMGWRWSTSQPGMPPMLVPENAPPGSIGHVAPNYVGDPGAAWSLLVHASRTEPGVRVLFGVARADDADGEVKIGSVIVVGALPRAIAEAWVLNVERTKPAPASAPLWKPEMSAQIGAQAVGGRRVIEVTGPEEQEEGYGSGVSGGSGPAQP